MMVTSDLLGALLRAETRMLPVLEFCAHWSNKSHNLWKMQPVAKVAADAAFEASGTAEFTAL
jgi:hypothetical protein